jgi:hypothetical protein
MFDLSCAGVLPAGWSYRAQMTGLSASVEGCTLVTADRKLAVYGIPQIQV